MFSKYSTLILLIFCFAFSQNSINAQSNKSKMHKKYLDKNVDTVDADIGANGFPSAINLIPASERNKQNLYEFKAKKCHIDDSLASSTNKQKKIDFTIRLGQGGFSDKRSPIGKLGGGQLTLDTKFRKFPVALSISSEYYTNSADPSHSYEIAGMTVFNLLSMTKIFKSDRVRLFLGRGIGSLEVPQDESENVEKGICYDFEAGVNVLAFWKIGFYSITSEIFVFFAKEF